MIQKLRDHIFGALGRMHRGEGGAVALMVLAATLIVFMIALIIYDAQNIGRDRLEVQAAADTAAWSQTSIEARSMNLIAYSNVGKRVTVSMLSYYYGLWLAYASILFLATILAVGCWILYAVLLAFVVTAGAAAALQPVCQELTKFVTEVGYQMFEEGPDLIELTTNLHGGHFSDDIKAFDDYQSYITGLTPWWSWSEGFSRGIRNGASVASGWPVPEQIGGSSIGAVVGNTGLTDSLPVEPASGFDAMEHMCQRTFLTDSGSIALDTPVNMADYAFKTLLDSPTSEGPYKSGWEKPALVAMATFMAAGFMQVTCRALMLGGSGGERGWDQIGDLVGLGEGSAPYQIRDFPNSAGGRAQWWLATSNLSFAYRPEAGRDDEREKYNFIQSGQSRPLYAMASGTFSMARAEVSYQNEGQPDAWHPSYSVRMRPIAFPGEWTALGGDVTLSNALGDSTAYMVLGAAIGELGNGFDFSGQSVVADFYRIYAGLQQFNDDRMEALPK